MNTSSLWLLALLASALSLSLGSASSVTCSDAEECDGDTLDDTDVYCYGYYACEDTDISATYGYMYGAYAAYDATVSSEYTYGYGLLSLTYADLSTYIGYIRGYLTCYYADIDSYSSTLYLYLYGFFAGYYADVLCYSGDTCHVYCGEVYGCYELDYYCYSGATCYYDCSDDSSYCPTLYSGVESEVLAITELGANFKEHKTGLTDDEISTYHQASRDAASQVSKEMEIDIDFDAFPNGEALRKEFESAMSGIDKSVHGKGFEAVVAGLTQNSLVTFVAGMIVMLLLGKVYAMCKARRSKANSAYVSYTAIDTMSA